MARGIKQLFKSRDRPAARNAVSDAIQFFFGQSRSGMPVNERTAMQLSAVYACVRVIAETVGSLPLHVYKDAGGSKVRAVDHPLYWLLHDEPNPEMTSMTFRETLMTHLLLWGNAYAQIIRDGGGRVLGIYPLLSDKMAVDRDKTGNLTYTYTRSGMQYHLRPEDVLHIPGLGFDGILGYSPVAVARNAVGLALSAEEYGSRFFANSARPSGVLEHPGTLKEPDKLRKSWKETYGGANTGNVAVLEEGMKFNSITMPNNEAQFLESRKFQVAEICRIYRVPPHMVADLDRATFSNIESQNISFAVHTIRPWLVRLEQSMNRSLFTDREKKRYFTHFNMDGLLRGNYESRMKGYSIGLQNGWMSPNDIRELENMNPIPTEEGGNLYIINGNMCKLKDAGIYSKNKSGEVNN